MVSLKRYLNSNDSDDTLRQTIALLVEKFGTCAVEADTHELETFRSDIKGIHEALTTDLPHESIVTQVESANHTLETYNRRITKTIGRQNNEFQTIIRMLQNSLASIAGDNT